MKLAVAAHQAKLRVARFLHGADEGVAIALPENGRRVSDGGVGGGIENRAGQLGASELVAGGEKVGARAARAAVGRVTAGAGQALIVHEQPPSRRRVASARV